MKLPCKHSRLDLIIAGTEDLELYEMKNSKQLDTYLMDAKYSYLFFTAL